ncbi:MAG: hypothetical protein AAF708_16980, partial [Deinococcota bacterium]
YPAGPAGLIQPIELTSTGILNHAQNVDAAKEFASYLNTDDVWLPLARDGFAFFIPAFEKFEDNPAMPWNTDPKLAAFKGIAQNGAHSGYPAGPTLEANDIFVNFVVTDMFAKVTSGAASVDDAIADAIEAIEDIYS